MSKSTTTIAESHSYGAYTITLDVNAPKTTSLTVIAISLGLGLYTTTSTNLTSAGDKMIVEVPSPSKFYVTRSLTWDGSVTSATITGESGKPGIVVVEVLSGSPITSTWTGSITSTTTISCCGQSGRTGPSKETGNNRWPQSRLMMVIKSVGSSNIGDDYFKSAADFTKPVDIGL